MNQEKERQLLNVYQVAEKLRIGTSTVFLWSKTNKMPSQVKLARASRWFEDEIDQWLAERPRGSYGQK